MKKLPSLPAVDFKALAADFRNLNPQDVGAWPLAPRVAALLGLLVAILIAGWWFVWNEQLETLNTREQEEVKLKEDYIAKKTKAVNLDLYRQQLNEIDRSFGALLRQLPSKAEVDSLLIEVNQSGMGRGLQFELFRPAPEVGKDFYAELPINVKLTGSYHDFGAFAGDIARMSRIVTLNNLSISTNKDNVLVMETIAKTFRYLDEEELAAKRKAEQAAKAAKGGKK